MAAWSSDFSGSINNLVFRALAKAMALCALPVIELVFFRWLLHSALELRLGFGGFVDADVILPGFFSFAIFLFVLERDQPVRLCLQRRWLVANALAFAIFLLFNLVIVRKVSAVGPLWWSLCAAMALTALFSFWSFSSVLSNRFRLAAIPCAICATSVWIVKSIYVFSWPVFGKLSATVACHVLRQLDGQTTCQWKSQYYLGIVNKPMYALVGPACGGAEIITLFSMCVFLYALVDSDRLVRRALPLLFVASLLFATLLNVARIVTVIEAGVLVNDLYPNSMYGNMLVAKFFHTHVGWVFYFVGLIFFFGCVERMRAFVESRRSGVRV